MTTGHPVYGRYSAEAHKEAAGSPGPSTYGSVRAPTATNAKPFANYQAPDVISPWMYLYRRTGNPAVSNYYQFVRPRMNQTQLNSQVRGLENTARDMNSGLQNLNRRTNKLQGYPGQKNYMDYNNYYPGLER